MDGSPCPEPVVITKNITRYARNSGFNVEVKDKRKNYKFIITIG
ncbi:MAG: hypothetical protein ACOCV3_01885 [Halanaerobiales bacterium]